MESVFSMRNEEKIFKTYFENGHQNLLKKPMTYDAYKKLPAAVRKNYRNIEQYHEPTASAAAGNTIRDVAVSGDTVKLTQHYRYSLPILHNHDYIELAYVYEGTCRHFVETQEFTMQQGDLCILTPTAVHAIAAAADDAVIVNIMMSRKLFTNSFLRILRGDRLLADFFEKVMHDKDVSPYILFPTKDDPVLRELVLRMYRERVNKDYLYNEAETLYVKQIFIHLVRHYEMMAVVANPVSHKKENHIVALLGYIEVNYSHVTLKETAAFFCYNETYLGKMIQRYTGKTFSALIRELKMENAVKLLEETDLSITEIAQEVGCYDSSHLTKTFKQTYGSSPNAWRKEHQKRKD